MGATLSQPASDKHTESGQDDRYHYAVSEMQGWRISMEDAHTTVLSLNEEAGDKNSFFAVYDGHGGGTTAKFAGQNVHKRLLAEEAYAAKQYEEAMKRAFLGTDEDLLGDPAHAKDPSGCTAVAALIAENKIYVANAGDSRSVISVKGEVKPLSYDHKPTNDVEKARITAAGGYIEYGRVNGNLALSRAIGDFEFKKNYTVTPEKQVITADPDLTAHDLTEEDEFLVIACDGIWDCLTSQQVVDFIRREVAQGKELTEICENMCEHCLAPDTSSGAGIGCDNMTVMIIALLHGRTKEEWAAWVKKRFDDKHGYATPEAHPQLYSATRMAAFKARRADWDRRRAGGNTEASPTDGVLDLSRLQGLAQVLGSTGGISFRPGGQILSDTGALMFGGDDDDSDESDTEMSGGPGIHSQAITIGRDSPDEQSLNSLKDRLDAFEREEEEEAKRLSGDTPAAEHALPNGDASKPIPPVEQLKPLPGGDSVNPVVAAEGLMDKSEDPLKAI